MPTCNINYDNNPNGIYYAGQTLSGVIQLNNDKLRSIRGVTLRIEGYSMCQWSENEGSGKSRRTVYYTGREDYINSFSYLVGSFETSKIDFAPGLHQFNITCMLPPQLPTSLESKYGYIRYQVKVEMERPWKTDYKYCFAFTVIRNLDLNYESPMLRNPLKVEKSKQFFFGFSSKALHISAETLVTGYVSGQQVPVSINVNNESSVEVTEVAVELVKILHYASEHPRVRTRERIERMTVSTGPGVPIKSKKAANMSIMIPPVPPTNLGTCRVVTLSYEVHVVAKVGAFHRDAVLRMPITIGTVPLFSRNSMPNYQQYIPPPQQSVNNSNWNPPPTTSSSAVIPPSTNPYQPTAPQNASTPEEYDMPPPSYQEATMNNSTLDGETDDGFNDQLPFNPRYPVFNFANYGIQPPHAQPTNTTTNQMPISNQPQNMPNYPPLAPPPYNQPPYAANQYQSNEKKKY